MSEIARPVAFGKLNALGYRAIESATVFCKLRGNPYVELSHWIHQILQVPDSDLSRIIQQFDVNPSKLAADLTSALDRLPRGATSLTDLSGQIDEAVERGWVYATLLFKTGSVRTGHLLVGILKTPSLRNSLMAMSREFEKVKIEKLMESFDKLTKGSAEDGLGTKDGSAVGESAGTPGEASGAMAPAAMGKQEALKKFSQDITERAAKGELDPVVGRDDEIRQMVDILMRRRQNNPILTGEAGVGKTAVVEGLAQRIVKGDVPPMLRDVSIRALDLTLLQAGASMKGEFEQRLRSVIEEVQASTKPIILFIDEAHTLIGAGGAAGQGDAANLLKPALARGTLRTIAATTWAEYKKHIEKDPALTRRFQVVQVDEPAEAKAVAMLRGVATAMEKHHKVQLLDEALEAAAKLSHRYIPARQLPDKAVSLLDTACARVAVGLHATPPDVEDCTRRIEMLEIEKQIVARETAVGYDHVKRVTGIEESLTEERARLEKLNGRWKEEKGIVEQILDLRGKLRATPGSIAADAKSAAIPAKAASLPTNDDAKFAPSSAPVAVPALAPTPVAAGTTTGAPALSDAERAAALDQLKTLQAKLTEMQGENPLILPAVDAQAIAAVVADWTGIPVGRMVKNEVEAVLKLADTLEKRVIGQKHALDALARRIQTSRAGLDNPSKPIGVFMLVGPSGVGKTETALALAEALYGGEQNVIAINMSEFQEAHTVSTLKGSPPGYVGYGEGGRLTEAVRRKPYSIVLLDEMEKAHGDIHELFFQVFDKGLMEDGEGRKIDFKNTIILATSNAAQDVVIKMCADPALLPTSEGIEQAMRPALTKVFPDALLNRMVVVPYYPISRDMLDSIIKLQLNRVKKRLWESHKATLEIDESVPKFIAEKSTELERGARLIDAIITNTMLPEMGRRLLEYTMDGKSMSRIRVSSGANGFEYAFE